MRLCPRVGCMISKVRSPLLGEADTLSSKEPAAPRKLALGNGAWGEIEDLEGADAETEEAIHGFFGGRR